MGVIIAHASKDEHNTYKDGTAGDQTGKEVCTRSWYNNLWTHVIRFKDSSKAQKVATAMLNAANNSKIGYDQNQRNTCLTYARKVGYDLSKVTTACEVDCSSLVAIACMYAGVAESKLYASNNSVTTRTIRSKLVSTGLVDVYTSTSYTRATSNLKVGDILLKEGSHVAVVVSV